MRTFFTVWLFLITFVLPVSGEGYKINVHLGSAPGRQLFLTHYYGESVYVDDTTHTDLSGYGVFQRDTLLPQGLYKVYLDKDNHFDFLLGADQTLTIRNPAFSLENMEIEGADESREFLVYMHWLREQQRKLALLDTALARASDENKEGIRRQITSLSDTVSGYWKQKSAQYPGTLLAAFLMAKYYEHHKPDMIPAAYTVNDSLKWIYEYTYRKDHFFDYFDITDERFLYTPLVKSKLDTYFGKVLLQMVDSVREPVYRLIRKSEAKPHAFRYVTAYFLNASLNSKVMGMDALFVDIARDYYLSGKTTWADSATLAKIRENVIFMEHNLIGNQARDLIMETFEGQPFRLYQQKNKYTILVFFEPNCSHCNEFVPKLYDEIYLPYRDKGLEVIAGYTMDNKTEWLGFIEKYHLYDWVNVWDPHHLSRFKIIYDTRTTPSVYLLDQDKKIIAKKFSIEFLKSYLGHNLGGSGTERQE